jgi:hypothetical protein
MENSEIGQSTDLTTSNASDNAGSMPQSQTYHVPQTSAIERNPTEDPTSPKGQPNMDADLLHQTGTPEIVVSEAQQPSIGVSGTTRLNPNAKEYTPLSVENRQSNGTPMNHWVQYPRVWPIPEEYKYNRRPWDILPGAVYSVADQPTGGPYMNQNQYTMNHDNNRKVGIYHRSHWNRSAAYNGSGSGPRIRSGGGVCIPSRITDCPETTVRGTRVGQLDVSNKNRIKKATGDYNTNRVYAEKASLDSISITKPSVQHPDQNSESSILAPQFTPSTGSGVSDLQVGVSDGQASPGAVEDIDSLAKTGRVNTSRNLRNSQSQSTGIGYDPEKSPPAIDITDVPQSLAETEPDASDPSKSSPVSPARGIQHGLVETTSDNQQNIGFGSITEVDSDPQRPGINVESIDSESTMLSKMVTPTKDDEQGQSSAADDWMDYPKFEDQVKPIEKQSKHLDKKEKSRKGKRQPRPRPQANFKGKKSTTASTESESLSTTDSERSANGLSPPAKHGEAIIDTPEAISDDLNGGARGFDCKYSNLGMMCSVLTYNSSKFAQYLTNWIPRFKWTWPDCSE